MDEFGMGYANYPIPRSMLISDLLLHIYHQDILQCTTLRVQKEQNLDQREEVLVVLLRLWLKGVAGRESVSTGHPYMF